MAAKTTKRPATKPSGKRSAAMPAARAKRAMPSFEGTPTIPSIPTVPSTPTLTATPSIPSIPSVPSIPSIPSAKGLRAAVAAAVTGSGDDVLRVALSHVGEPYVFGARVPLANAKWRGPWDCAEFASWCVFQATGVLYGAEPRNDAVRADAFTGFWAQQARADGAVVTVEDAAHIPGALLLRVPGSGRTGHIAISDGAGGTVEAHSSKDGVIRGQASGRVWDMGVLVPGVSYLRNEKPVVLAPPPRVLRLTNPLTRGPLIKQLQRALEQRGFQTGSADGIYGPQTADAVQMFQRQEGLVADGEAGPQTLKALGLA